MINSKPCFSEMINSPVRKIAGRVELYEGSALLQVFTHRDNLKSFTVERLGEENKFYGYGICQKLNVKLLDKDRKLNITTANTLEVEFGCDSDYEYPFPYFKVTEVHRDENTNEASVTAYDAIYNATNYKVADLDLPSGYTIREFTVACANLLGLPLRIDTAADSVFNTYYPEKANFEGTENLREAMNDIAEATQTIYYINKNWELVFKRLDIDGEPVERITKNKYITLESKTNRRLTSVCHVTELGDNVIAEGNESGTTQYIRDNAFWDMREDIGVLVEDALAAVYGLTINQFEMNWRGNFLIEIGDKIAMTTKDDDVVISYLLNDTVSYNGFYSQKTRWNYTDTPETPANPSTLGDALKQTYARVDKVNKEINLVASRVETNSSEISAIKLNTDSISASVTNVEKTLADKSEADNKRFDELGKEIDDNEESNLGKFEEIEKKVEAQMTSEDVKILISESIDDGVNKVTTSTGFTFNDEGLKVSKSDSDLSTQITEDGMTIDNNGDEVLTVNHYGVNAANLHATTYLFIGSSSRFEDFYKDNELRTGCFWVGV